MSVTLAKYFVPKWKLLCFTVLALAFCASNSWAQAPSIIFDAQQTVGDGYSGPQALVVSSNGTVFIADTNNNRIVALATFLPQLGVNTVVSTAPYVLSAPASLALDAHGNLFVGDAPTTGGRIIELYGDGNGNLTGVANPAPIVSGPPLVDPIALTFDSAGTLFIGDFSANGNIYSLAAGTTALTPLTFTGLPAQFAPAALLRDASNNLYISDNGGFSQTDLGGIYKAPATGGAAATIPTEQFSINQPSGMAFDAAGNLYVATLLGSGTGYNPGQQFLVIPALSPTTPYILPNSGVNGGASLAFDAHGNLDVLDSVDNAVIQLSSPNPVNLGNVFVGQAGSPVLFNFEFNAPVDLRGFRVLSQGDVSTEISQAAGGNCTLGNHNTIGAGGPRISAYFPYSCKEYYEGTPTYPGVRNGAILVRGAGTTILASAPVWQTAFAGAEVIYPLTATTTVKNLQQPQAIAISGLNQDGVRRRYPGRESLFLRRAREHETDHGKHRNHPAHGAQRPGSGWSRRPIYRRLWPRLWRRSSGESTDDHWCCTISCEHWDTAAAPDRSGLRLSGQPVYRRCWAGRGICRSQQPRFPGEGTSRGNSVSNADGEPGRPNGPVSIIFPQALATDPYTADLLIGDGGDPSSIGRGCQNLRRRLRRGNRSDQWRHRSDWTGF